MRTAENGYIIEITEEIIKLKKAFFEGTPTVEED